MTVRELIEKLRLPPQDKKPIAKPVCPVAKRKITAGTETTAVPSGGIVAAIPATTAQMAGLGT